MLKSIFWLEYTVHTVQTVYIHCSVPLIFFSEMESSSAVCLSTLGHRHACKIYRSFGGIDDKYNIHVCLDGVHDAEAHLDPSSYYRQYGQRGQCPSSRSKCNHFKLLRAARRSVCIVNTILCCANNYKVLSLKSRINT